MKNKKTPMQKFKPSLLSATVVAGLGFTSVSYAADDYKRIGDLEIYEAAKGGQVTLMMMLDVSGSMTDVDVGCANPIANTSVPSQGTVTYYLKDKDGNVISKLDDGTDISKGVKLVHKNVLFNGKYVYCDQPTNRIEKLKQALLDVIHKEGAISNSVKMGVGTYPTRNLLTTGSIAIPAKELTREHRWELMKYISTISASGATPAAQAYVEAGAYMLGTNTAQLGASRPRVLTVGTMRYDASSGRFRLNSCGLSATSSPSGAEGRPEPVSINGSIYQWYFCNDTYDLTIPPFDYDNSIKAGSMRATPTQMDKLDFGLLPKFDVIYGGPKFPAKETTNETALKDIKDWKDLDGNYIGGETYTYQYDFITSRGVIRRGTNTLTEAKDGRGFGKGYGGHEIYFGRKLDYKAPYVNHSGFPFSDPSTKKDANNYQSPIGDSPADVNECDGYGIYFLTDGNPNSGTGSVLESANLSLGHSGSYTPTVDKTAFPNGDSGDEGYWNTIASYSKDLYSKNNPLKAKIKTATVGFGSVFAPKAGQALATKTVTFEGKNIEVVDCDQIPDVAVEKNLISVATGQIVGRKTFYYPDSKNLCRWGEKGYGYGNGGFLATSDSTAVANSVIKFVDDLNQTIPTSPAGTISIPGDPLSASNIQPYAYLPMIQPEVDKNFSTWEGNLKKYHTLYGTLYGKSRQRLYKTADQPTRGNDKFPSALNPSAEDLWQTGAPVADNTSVEVGGSRNMLKHPDDVNKANIRSVYVETEDATKKATMVKVGVANGTTLVNFDKLDSRYSALDMAYLLNYLGFNVSLEASAYPGKTRTEQLNELQTALASASLTAKANHGGVLHSVPVLASYGGKYDNTTGDISSNEALREDHLLYGSMDGALHMVNARDGSENFAFIPRAMFDDVEQRGALKTDSVYAKIGSPKFGVDAPWSTDAKYKFTNSGMEAEKMFAYGGLRMGGVGFYGLNITNRNNPTLAFSINKTTKGFDRLGQTWSKPLVANIKTGPNTLTDTKKVLIFGGGYDMCYENPRFKLNDSTNSDTKCANKMQAEGNAVYMVDAETGALLQTWTANTTTDGRQYMKHSIVGDIVGRDRNNDGNIDHLYFADLGGQVFRIDLRSGMPANNTHLTRRVVRLFDANAGTMPANHLPFRFYEKPAVSIHETEGGRIGVVAISSGDRSSPTHKHRTLNDANRIFGIIDRDVATFRANGDTPMSGLATNNLTNDHLNDYDTKGLMGDSNKAKRAKYIDDLIKKNKHGWFYKMTRFENSENVKNLKSVGSSVTRGNIHYASIYNPDYDYAETSSCSAKIRGGTERQLFCLPWGICAAPDGTLADGAANGTLGYMKAGPGIQELATSTFTDTEGKSTNMTVLIGQQTYKERMDAEKANNTGIGGNGDPMVNAEDRAAHIPEGANTLTNGPISEEKRFMKVERWYDLAQAENIQ